MTSIRGFVDWLTQLVSQLSGSGPVGAGIALAIAIGSLLIIKLVFGLIDRKLQSWQGLQFKSLSLQRRSSSSGWCSRGFASNLGRQGEPR